MRTYILGVPDDNTDPAVHAALADLLRQHLITFAPAANNLLAPLSEEEFAAELRQALDSPVLSADQAKAYIGL